MIARIIQFAVQGKKISVICLILLIFYCQRDCTDYTVLLVGWTQTEWVRISRNGYLWRALPMLIGRHAFPR